MTDIDPDEARDTADDILSRSEFRERPQTLASRALEWITDFFGDLLSDIVGGERGVFIGYLVVVVAIVVALYLLWRVLPRQRLRGPAAVEPDVAVVDRLSRRQWLELAVEAEASGRWAEALRARYRALIEGLADGAQLSPEPSTTAGEHRQRFAAENSGRPGRIERFDGTTDRYEQVWFGADPAHDTDVVAAAAADDELLSPGR